VGVVAAAGRTTVSGCSADGRSASGPLTLALKLAMSAGASALAPCRAALVSSGSSAWHTSSGPIVLVPKLSSRLCLLSLLMDVSGARP
jgi:hypothetical protein